MDQQVRESGDSPRLSVLAVSSELPWPLNTGGHLRTFHLLRALAERFRLRLVVPVEPDRFLHVEELRQRQIEVLPVEVKPRRSWREGIRVATSLLRGEPYVCYRRHDHRAVRDALRKQIADDPPDVLYLDHLDSLQYREVAAWVPCVMDLHNVYSTLVRRTADEQSSPLKRAYLRREARLLDQKEREAAHVVSALMTVSDRERQHFASLGEKIAALVPNGVDCATFASLPLERTGPPVVLYVGAMSWSPNAQAAQFLAREVLPVVRRTLPDARLLIVGRDPPPELVACRDLPGVEVTGGVPDVLPYFVSAQVLAVPLEAGGGTRLKILEAFAAGLPVVSTAIGCEGIDAVPGEHLLVAERERMAEGIVALLQDQPLRTRLAVAARELARSKYDWQSIGNVACNVVSAVCS